MLLLWSLAIYMNAESVILHLLVPLLRSSPILLSVVTAKIQSHSFICSKVQIGNNCFIGHGVTFTNDLFKSGHPSINIKDWLPTLVEDNVSIGSGATILPVTIANGCVIGAGSVVTKDLKLKGIYVGNPARLIRKL